MRAAATPQEWQQIVAAAKKEGKVVVDTFPGEGYKRALRAFTQAYPDIKLEHTGLHPSLLGSRGPDTRHVRSWVGRSLHAPDPGGPDHLATVTSAAEDAFLATREPGTLLLLGTAFAGAGLARWRQRRRSRA